MPVAVTSPFWLMALFIGGNSLLGKLDEIHYSRTTRFDNDRWKSPNKKYRYAVLDGVVSKVVTGGMTEAQVMELLGKPDVTDANNNWQYETKRPGWRFIDFSGGGLLIHFNTNRVVERAEINTWLD
ncbi:MAG: hypothetical protein WCS70_08440 [Verrucomicrobiota bacterium]